MVVVDVVVAVSEGQIDHVRTSGKTLQIALNSSPSLDRTINIQSHSRLFERRTKRPNS
jgi:hypothetical protein